MNGADVSRTRDLVIANDALYQLSYRPGSVVMVGGHLAGSHAGVRNRLRGGSNLGTIRAWI